MIIFAYCLFFLALLASVTLNLLRYLHMFQLNSYHALNQFRWYGAHPGELVLWHMGGLCALISLLVLGYDTAGLIVAGCVMIFFLGFQIPQKAKKKLVFTHRVIRLLITSSLMYCAVVLLISLFAQGTIIAAIAFPMLQILSMLLVIVANVINMPVERLNNLKYINDAKRIINELPNLTVIGVTGSYGKTSTKFYLNKLLSAKYNVLMTPESYNTTLGVVKTIRSSLNATHEIFICEMGAKRNGEIKEICDIVHPKHSVITSIGPQHLESFKTIDNIISTKFEIADCITDGIVFLNYDNEYILNNKTDKKTVGYGIGAGNGKEYFATDITVSEKGTEFTLNCADGTSKRFGTKLIGAHNVQNIVGAIAVAHKLGVSFDELVTPVRRLECVPHRLQVNGGGNRIIIDDAFNSNPSGAKAALDTLNVFDGCKILITPGMVELGEKEYELNKEFGRQAAQVCDYIILVGIERAVPIKEGVLAGGFPEEKTFVTADLQQALRIMDNTDSHGQKKIVLLENDLPDNY